jgi:hypothetical protein
MELIDFLFQTQSEVQAEIEQRLSDSTSQYPYPESVFSEIVMNHMSEIGMTFEPEICHYTAKVGNANLKLSGYSISDDKDQLDLFITIYSDLNEIKNIPDSETKNAAEQCLRFLAKCAEGKLSKTMDESNDAYVLVQTIEKNYAEIDQIRIYVLTDGLAKSKNFKPREVSGKLIKLEVMDIERLHRHWLEGKPRDELIVNFDDTSGSALPCVYLPSDEIEFDCALTVIPAQALYFIYEKYGARVLEANVRSFLSATGKVNKGIRDTLRDDPNKFVAYNNGIVIVADEIGLGRTSDGGSGILWLKGMQIVNGGQTTASIYFSKKKDPSINLENVRIPAKVIILKESDLVEEESLISNISRYANSQNSVKQSDLSANKPYHIEVEKLSLTTYCPDGVGRWFYERASGSYNTFLAREGNTPARLKKLKESVIPSSRKFTKTDLAKYINSWAQKPYLVSLGAQKNFEKLMEAMASDDGQSIYPLPNVQEFKRIISKAILFKRAYGIVRPGFPAFQANITTYLVAILSKVAGDSFDFDRVWLKQDISEQLKEQLKIWSILVDDALNRSANGRMLSEWAKKDDCWSYVSSQQFALSVEDIPEIKIALN